MSPFARTNRVRGAVLTEVFGLDITRKIHQMGGWKSGLTFWRGGGYERERLEPRFASLTEACCRGWVDIKTSIRAGSSL